MTMNRFYQKIRAHDHVRVKGFKNTFSSSRPCHDFQNFRVHIHRPLVRNGPRTQKSWNSASRTIVLSEITNKYKTCLTKRILFTPV